MSVTSALWPRARRWTGWDPPRQPRGGGRRCCAAGTRVQSRSDCPLSCPLQTCWPSTVNGSHRPCTPTLRKPGPPPLTPDPRPGCKTRDWSGEPRELAVAGFQPGRPGRWTAPRRRARPLETLAHLGYKTSGHSLLLPWAVGPQGSFLKLLIMWRRMVLLPVPLWGLH